MPLERKNGPLMPMMCFDGDAFWHVEPRSHEKRVASLSGSAKSLRAKPSKLMKRAMSRQMIVDTAIGKEVQDSVVITLSMFPP